MRIKKGSFGYRLFLTSFGAVLIFAAVSIFANNYFGRHLILETIKRRVNIFLEGVSRSLGSDLKLEDLDVFIEAFFNKSEIHRLSIYSQTGELIYEFKGLAKFEDVYLPEVKNFNNLPDQLEIVKDKHLLIGKRLTYPDADGKKDNGFLLLSINLNPIFDSATPIFKYRILISFAIICLFLLLTFFLVKSFTQPFVSLLMNIEKISKGEATRIDPEKLQYEEFKKIISNFNILLEHIDTTKEHLVFSEMRLRTLLEKSKDIILMFNQNFEIEYASSTFVDITGVDINKAENRLAISEFIPIEDRKRLLPIYRKILRGKPANDFEIRFIGRNNEEKFFLTSWISRDAQKGNESGIILLGKDITEYKKIEAELRKQTEALETILFSLSHDLKSPIFTLKGMVLLFRKKYYDGLDEQGRHFIERISENIVKLERLISHMLDISRYERQVFKFENVNMKEIIQMIVEDMKPYIEECNATILLEGNFPTIKGDRDKLYIVFKNLIENSLKYRSPSRKLRIVIKSIVGTEGAELIVEDNGIGIESKYIERLFKPFSRAISQGENIPQGYGIGLAIVKGILDAHNAKIKVESSYGEWTKFRIIFNKAYLS